MNFNGGIYGDYEFANTSTRVLENRRYSNTIYNKRLFQSLGGNTLIFIAGLYGLSFYFIGKCSAGTINKSSKASFVLSLGATLTSSFLYATYLMDTEEFKYLLKNKTTLLKKIDDRLLEDHKQRNGVFPKIEKNQLVGDNEINNEVGNDETSSDE